MDGLQDLLTGRGHDITTLSVGTSDRCLSCRSASFLAMERQYMMGPWTPGKIAMRHWYPPGSLRALGRVGGVRGSVASS
jgi:hypothetical protein